MPSVKKELSRSRGPRPKSRRLLNEGPRRLRRARKPAPNCADDGPSWRLSPSRAAARTSRRRSRTGDFRLRTLRFRDVGFGDARLRADACTRGCFGRQRLRFERSFEVRGLIGGRGSNSSKEKPNDSAVAQLRALQGLEQGRAVFNRVKHDRRIATRYEKTARNYMAMMHLVSAMVWLL